MAYKIRQQKTPLDAMYFVSVWLLQLLCGRARANSYKRYQYIIKNEKIVKQN